MITLLIVDDQRLIRAGVRALCDSTDDITVVGEGANGVDAIRLVAEHNPDVVLMDLHMPGMDGIDATRHISAVHPQTAVLVLTTFDDDDHLYPALDAGATGFVVKDTDPEKLLDAIRRTADGDAVFTAQVIERLVSRAVTAHRHDSTIPEPVDLTGRERDILTLVCDGRSNQEIATELHLGVTTVKTHISALMAKTGCDNRVRLALVGVRYFNRWQ